MDMQNRYKRNGLIATGLLLGLIAIFTVSLSFVRPPEPNPADGFNTDRALASLGRILGDERPHPIDSTANDAVRERLLTEIRAIGFDPIVRDDFLCTDRFGGICGRVRNVMFWAVPPKDDVTAGVALMSHYDSVPAGPGAADDGSGMAASLEIARQLKDRDLPRPVLVLITDGEEIGLLGAESFVRSDPLAERIEAVVNLEARGVTGPASMFQTSRPNARDIAALPKTGRTALTNTLSSDIYDAMPNDTDLSRFLDDTSDRRVDATNYAFILGDAFYHTPGDNLANLDPRSVHHVSVNALASVEHFASRDISAEPEGQRLYFDVLTRGVVSVPFALGLIILLLAGGLNLAAIIKTGDWRDWRGWAVMPLALIASGVSAFGASALMDLLRDSGAYSAAYPWALRGLCAAIVVLTSVLITLWLTKGRDGLSTQSKSWLWISLLAAVGYILFSGTITIFAPALFFALFAAAAVLLGRTKLAIGLNVTAAIIFVITNLPLPGFAMAALGGTAAIFAILWAIPTTILLSSMKLDRVFGLPALGATTATVGLLIATLMLPPFAAHAPRGLSLQHVQSETGSFLQVNGSGPVPEYLNGSGDFVRDNPFGETLPRYARSRWTRPTPTEPDLDMTVTTIEDVVTDGIRRLTLQIDAPAADRLMLAPASSDALWSALSVNDVPVRTTRWGTTIAGRSARTARIEIELAENAPLGHIAALRYGLGPDLASLAASRPEWIMPRQDGDVRVRIMSLNQE